MTRRIMQWSHLQNTSAGCWITAWNGDGKGGPYSPERYETNIFRPRGWKNSAIRMVEDRPVLVRLWQNVNGIDLIDFFGEYVEEQFCSEHQNYMPFRHPDCFRCEVAYLAYEGFMLKQLPSKKGAPI